MSDDIAIIYLILHNQSMPSTLRKGESWTTEDVHNFMYFCALLKNQNISF